MTPHEVIVLMWQTKNSFVMDISFSREEKVFEAKSLTVIRLTTFSSEYSALF